MRILYTLNSGQPGGMEQHVLDLVEGMTERRHEVFVCCNDGPIAKWYEESGAKVFVSKIKLDIDPFYIFSLYKFIKANQIEVIHAHELKAVGNSLIAGWLAGQGSKVPIRVSHQHTPISEWQISTAKKKVNIFAYSTLVNLFSHAEIALTESRKKIKIGEGIKQNKLYTIPNGIDVQKFDIGESTKAANKNEILKKYNISPEKLVFGNISRISAEKGHETLINAFAKLLDYKEIDREKVHLFIGGGGDLEEYILKLIDELGLQNNITVTGKFKNEELVKFYNTFDAFVFPSLAEGFGLVLTEAMASRLPIICSNLEVLEEVGGSAVFAYFEPNDADHLAEKMYNLYTKKDMLQNIKESAFERVSQLFSMQKFISAYENLYLTLREGRQ